MNSPYMGNFQVTQTQHSAHDGLDLVGLESKEIHSTVNGKVIYAGWENEKNHSQGFGQYVCVYANDGNDYFFGHLDKINVSYGQSVKITDVIGIEGTTGKSTGNHCHYCARPHGQYSPARNISQISGIPNALGIYNDGFKPSTNQAIARFTINGVNYKIVKE